MKFKFSIFMLIVLIMHACQNKSNHSTDETKEVHKSEGDHWSYEGETGPLHWAEIEKDSDCNGLRQSPINIIDVDVASEPIADPIKIFYSSDVKIHDISNNGHTIQYNFEKGDYITIKDEKYELKQIHFHDASEHTINGVRYPLEMHMVHAGPNDQLAVIAVMAIEGKNSEPFDFLEKYLPVERGEVKEINANFDLNLNLPDNRDYYTYKGSLTTPPCTESVNWFVFKNPITVSLNQVKQLQVLMPFHNYRDEQPLNGRKVMKYVSG
jgi:carbonic anhydrase